MRAYIYFVFILVSLIASNPSIAQLSADFSANKTTGCGSLAGVKFTDQSAGTITTRRWEFGNSNSSSLKDPIANYTSPGIYDVRLIVSNATTSDTMTKKAFIRVFNNPTADFSFTPSSGCSPLIVTFTNNSTKGDTTIKEFKWDFADGSLGSDENPVHEYLANGTFQPSLEVIDHNGCSNFTTTTNVIVNRPPKAAFSTISSPISCADSLLVEFVNNSQGTNLTYEWNFGDNNTSTLPNPSHMYRGLGSYDVRLIVSDPNCKDTIIMEEFVRLEETIANFSLSKKDYCVGELIEFKNNSSGSAFFNWDFGDGTSSSEREPAKIFNDSGTYIVELSAFAGPCLSDTTDTIKVHFIKAGFAIQRDTICQRSDTTVFINQSTNAANLIWKIGVAVDTTKQFLMGNVPELKLGYSGLTNTEFKDGYYPDTLIAINSIGCRDTLARDSSRKVDELEIDSILFNLEGKAEYTDTLGRMIIGGCFPQDFDFFALINGHKPVISWDWDFGNGTNSVLELPNTITYNDDNFYEIKLMVENNLACIDSSSLLVQLGAKQSPDFSLTSGDTLCPNDTVFITDHSTDKKKIQSYTYIFMSTERRGEASSDSGDAIFTNFPDTGYYAIEQKISSNGCDTLHTKDSLLYVEGPIADFIFIPMGDCFDIRNVKFESDMRGVTRFKWDFGDGTTDTINENLVHTFPAETTYDVTLTVYNDSSDCDTVVAATQVMLRRPSSPLIVIDTSFHLLNTNTFCKPDSAKYTIINLVEYDSLSWFLNGELIGTTDSVFVKYDSIGSYLLEVKGIDVLGCKDSSFHTLYVSGIIARFDTSIVNCQPFELQFSDASITDTTVIDWLWTFGNGDTALTDNAIVQYNTPGDKSIFLKVENILGCVDSIEARDFINTDIIAVSFRKSDVDLCAGDTMIFRNTSQANGVQFTWDFGDGTTLDTNIDFVKHQYKTPGSYTVTLSALAGNGCIIKDEQINIIHVDAIPIAGFIADTLFANCVPFEVGFVDTSKGNIVEWEWRFGDTASSILSEPDHVYTTVNEFDVFLKVTSPNGCSDSLTKQAYIKIVGPTGTFTIDKDTVCVNEPVTFTLLNTENTNSFLWDFGDGKGSTDSIVIHHYDTTGLIRPSLIFIDTLTNCDIARHEELFVFDVASDFAISADSGCSPFTVDFTKQSSGDDSFLWKFGQGASSTDINPSYTYTQPGTYKASLEISSTIGCKDTSFMDLVALPTPIVSLTSDTGICVDDSILLVASGGLQYSWLPNQDLLSVNQKQDSVIVFPKLTTNYQVVLSNQFNCLDSAQMELIIQQKPSFALMKDTRIIIGEELNLNVQAGIGFNYRWRPAEGLSCTDCPNPIAQPLETTQYIVDIWDDYGCYPISDTIIIEVDKIFTLDVPSAFSPNGDGVNDIIFARGFGLKELIAFKIYNRFGELVFESNSFDHGWNGKYRDQDQNIETYIYTVEALTFGGEVLTKKGNISLLK